MADDVVLRVRRNFKRPDPKVYAAFDNIMSGFVVDAMMRVGALDHGIHCVTKANRVVGSALTVNAGPRDNLAVYAAISMAKPGDILVIDARGYPYSAAAGDNVVWQAKNSGVTGFVVDGMVRDLPGIEETGVPVWARGITPNSPFKNGPGEVGTRISVGGVSVESGDLVYADSDGVVIVPQARLAEVLVELEAIKKKEAQMEKLVKGGQKLPGWVPEFMASNKVQYLD